MDNKNNDTNAFKRLSKLTTKELAKQGNDGLVADGDVKILMPMQAALMHAGLSKIQQNVVLAVIEGMKGELQNILWSKAHGIQLDLFAQQEITDDSRPIKFKLYFKNFGVSARHYQQLSDALMAMSTIPVEIPTKGAKTGIEYISVTNFCRVYIPKEQMYRKYCIVSMEKDVADMLSKFDLGYFFVGRLASWRMSTKYSERLYWFIKAHLNNGGVTVSMSELKKIFDATDTFIKSGKFEERVLKPSSEEIKSFFTRGECECWFEYEKIYNNGRKRGEPDAIAFKVYGRTQKALEGKTGNTPDGVISEIHDIMTKDFGMSDFFVNRYMKLVDDSNKEAFFTQLITLKLQVDQKAEDKKPVKNLQAYLVRSINNFFEKNSKKEDGVIEVTEAYTEHNDKYAGMSYPDRWNAIIQRLCQYRSDEYMRETFDNVSFDTFNPHSGSLMLCVVGEGVCERIEGSQQDLNLLSRLLREYYDFKSFKWHSFKTREEFLKYKRSTSNK